MPSRSRILGGLIVVLILSLLGPTPARAGGEVSQSPKKSLAHDGKAFSYWQAEIRRRWRKALRERVQLGVKRPQEEGAKAP